jgi:small subunit ribosomal protein S24e
LVASYGHIFSNFIFNHQFSNLRPSSYFPSPQMIVDIIHPGRANVAKAELQGVIGGMHKTDGKLVVLFGFRTKFGGGKSTGFCVIYDNEDALMKFEPKHRLVRQGLAERKERSRKALKEAKNKGKKVRGTGASIAKHKAKRAAQAD